MCLLDSSKSDEALSLVTRLSDTLTDRTLEVNMCLFCLRLFACLVWCVNLFVLVLEFAFARFALIGCRGNYIFSHKSALHVIKRFSRELTRERFLESTLVLGISIFPSCNCSSYFCPQNCTLVLDTLLEGTFGLCEEVVQEYVSKCNELFPYAVVFTKPEERVNGTDVDTEPSLNDDLVYDGEDE